VKFLLQNVSITQSFFVKEEKYAPAIDKNAYTGGVLSVRGYRLIPKKYVRGERNRTADENITLRLVSLEFNSFMTSESAPVNWVFV
jgi:hypothetical protein